MLATNIMKLGDRVKHEDRQGEWQIQGAFLEGSVCFHSLSADVSSEILKRKSGDHLAFREERNLTETETVFIVVKMHMRPYPGLYGPPTLVLDFFLATPDELTVVKWPLTSKNVLLY